MADRPIIFSAPMIRALIEGRKTQTRRVVRLPQWAVEISDIGDDGYTLWCVSRESGSIVPALPQYLPHDRLWVREAFKVGNDLDPTLNIPTMWVYRADGGDPTGPWKPSIHMPRWASRLTLVVTDVRVQRLQEISEGDAEAEGLASVTKDGRLWKWGIPDRDGLPGIDDFGWRWRDWDKDPRVAFMRLWNSIHEKKGFGWKENPWVVAISFETHRCNIDSMEEA